MSNTSGVDVRGFGNKLFIYEILMIRGSKETLSVEELSLGFKKETLNYCLQVAKN